MTAPDIMPPYPEPDVSGREVLTVCVEAVEAGAETAEDSGVLTVCVLLELGELDVFLEVSPIFTIGTLGVEVP